MSRQRSLVRLLAWLGPWRSSTGTPHGIRRETWLLRAGCPVGRKAWRAGERPRIEESRLEARVYLPAATPVGSYVIAPGLHFEGPDDPRLDRFCRVLAHAGFRVIAPIVPAYAELVLHPSAAPDFAEVVRQSAQRFSDRKLAIFGISFGSALSFEAAAREPQCVDGVITFGGFCEIESAIRFALSGVSRDPLNQPALFLNLLPYLDVAGDVQSVADAWRELVFRTWGKMDLKARGRLESYARALLPRVSAPLRELFLIGAGVLPGADRLAAEALPHAGRTLAFANPSSVVDRVRCPVVICHGRDDDVIPWNEAEKLEALLFGRVPVRRLMTGMYGHTGVERPGLRALGREVKTLLEMAQALAQAGEFGRRWG